jgi:DNA gyrase subunit A
MTALAETLLEDIDKETVDFAPNFDDSHVEPVVFPSLLPNLLINGASGIAVGMATHMPPHNIGEVIDAALLLLDDPECTVNDLMQCVTGPDFPTGGVILDNGSIRTAYTTGSGVIQIRGRVRQESLKMNNREVEALVVTEIPYQVNKTRLIERIASLVNEKEIDGIAKLRDESDRSGMRIVMELKRDATAEVVLNQLYKSTPLQSSFGIINLSIVEGKPVVCSLKLLLSYFLSHRRDVLTRRSIFELRKANERRHILDGFRIALLNLDQIIALIRKAETPQVAKEGLRNEFSLSLLQAQAILELRLQRLTGMERLAIEKEHEEILAQIAHLEGLLRDPAKINAVIREDLRLARDKYRDNRRTEIQFLSGNSDLSMEDLIEDEEMAITISHGGYIKRTALAEYKAQRRGGKGKAGSIQSDADFIEHLFVASTHQALLVFTNLGRLYWLKVYEIPESGRVARGRALVNLLEFKDGEELTAILPVRKYDEGIFVLMATEKGVIKRTSLLEFSRERKGGLIAGVLDEGDSLIGVSLCKESSSCIISTKKGLSIHFSCQDVRAMGRVSRGVKAIELESDDLCVSMTTIEHLEDPNESAARSLLTICENGYGKRTLLSEYRMQRRGGRGLIDIQTSGRNGSVVGSMFITDPATDLMLITSSSKIIRIRANTVSLIGRNTRGVRIVDLDQGEKVLAIDNFVDTDTPEV